MPRLLPLFLALALATAAHAQHATAYPNPLGAGPLTVQHDAEAAELELYDLLGRRLDVRSDLAAGVYLWRLRLGDGTATPAQQLTRLSSGPLDIQLVRQRTQSATVPAFAAASAPPDGNCRIASPVFGGFQHVPLRGSDLSIDGTMTVTRTGAYASSETCLGGVAGVGMRFPVGASPWKIEEGTAFQVEISGVMNDGPSTPAQGTVSLKSVAGGFGDLRALMDASTPKLVEVLQVAPDGTETVVSSTIVPAGTPETRRLARLAAGGGATGVELAALTMSPFHQTGTALLDSVASVRMDFRTTGAGWILIQSADGPVQGNAIVVTQPRDGWILIQSATLQTTGDGYEIDDLGFLSSGSATPTVLNAGAPSVETPAWLRTADPDNQVWKSPAGLDIRCERGQSCATYGVRTTADFSSSGSANPTVFQASGDLAPPLASSFTFGDLKTVQGRGLLFGANGQVDWSMVYVEEVPSGATVQGEARVRLSTPVGRSLVVRYDDTGTTPTITGGVVRYLRDGVVRRQETLADGVPVDLGLRVELSDAQITTGPDGSPLLRFTDVVRPNSEVQVSLTTGPPVEGYLIITMENIVRWSLGFASTGSANPTVFTSAR